MGNIDFIRRIFGKKYDGGKQRKDAGDERNEAPLTDEMIEEMERSVKKNKNGRYIFDPKKPYGSVDNPVRVGMPDGVEVLVYDRANKRWILTDGLGNGWIR